MAWKRGQKESGLTDADVKQLGVTRDTLKLMGQLGGLASAKSKGNISDHDYQVKLNKAYQEKFKAELARKLAGQQNSS